MSYVVGFDLSLKAPAAVALPLDWRPGDWKHVKAWLGKPPTPDSKADYAGRMARYAWLAGWASSCVRDLGSNRIKLHAFVEQYAFSKDTNTASQIIGAGEFTKYKLWDAFRLELVPLVAAHCRKVVLGANPRRGFNGIGTSKDAVKVYIQDTIFNHFGAPKTWKGDNECDAFIVASTGLSELGGKILSLPPPEKPAKPRKR
jgi:hypothetical protein